SLVNECGCTIMHSDTMQQQFHETHADKKTCENRALTHSYWSLRQECSVSAVEFVGALYCHPRRYAPVQACLFANCIVAVLLKCWTVRVGTYCNWDYDPRSIAMGIAPVRSAVDCTPASSSPGGWRGSSYCAGSCMALPAGSCPEV